MPTGSCGTTIATATRPNHTSATSVEKRFVALACLQKEQFMKLAVKKENGEGKPVFSGTKSGDASGRRQWLRAVQGSLGELGEGALQLLNGTLPYVPRVQVQENADEVLVSVSLPGIDQGSLEVLLEKSSLVIRGASTTEHETRRRNYRRIAKLTRTFERAIPLHGEIERNGTLATMHGEVLTVRLPKADAARLPAHRVAVAADPAHGTNSPGASSRETAAV
jgi:HSP20 family protein